MSQSKHTKKALLASALSVVVCLAMLIGSTFAWFTDSVASSNNRIQAGNLNIDLLVKDEEGTYQSVGENKDSIFNYDKWEPGYTVVKNVKVSTTGNLALKYTLNIVPTGVVSELAEVIDVYYAPEEVEVKDRSLEGLTRLGTLKDVFDGRENTVVRDTLIPQEGNTEDYATIALQMQTGAGNEYQGMTVGPFDLRIVATQFTYEEDSFGSDYDGAADYRTAVSSGSEFVTALSSITDGSYLVLNENIQSTANLDIINSQDVILDFNNQTADVSNNNIAFRVAGSDEKNASAVFSNGTIRAGQGTYCTVSAANAELTLNNMKLENVTAYGCSVKAFDGGVINLNNVDSTSTIGGGISAAGGTVNVNGGTFTQIGYHDHNSCIASASNNTGVVNLRDVKAVSENFGLYIYNSGGTINVYSGSYTTTGDRAVLKADYNTGTSTINIYGGDFIGKIDINAKATLNIEAGTFTNTGLTLEQFSAYVAEGHSVTEKDGVFTVK